MKTLLLLLCFSLSLHADPFIDVNSDADLNAYITQSGFNGVVLVAREQNILLKKAYGFKSLEQKNLLSENDVFQIGSITKQFVAASVLKLQEQGKVNLDEDITVYLPELTNFKDVQVRDVLNHSSGIKNYTDVQSFWTNLKPDQILSLVDLVNYITTLTFDFAPRSDYKYSNSGYIVAGRLVEKLSGQTWFDYIRENFLIPLGMTHTTAGSDFKAVSDVVGHVLVENEFKPMKSFNVSWAQSAGMIQSNAEDLLKWTQIYYGNLLSDNSKAQMQQVYKNNYGLGVNHDNFLGDDRLSHGGRTPGFVSELDYLKNSKLTLVTLDNIDGQAHIQNVVLEYYLKGRAQAIKNREISLAPEKLNDYVGTFASQNPNSKMQFKLFIRDNNLILQTNDGQPPYTLKPIDADTFSLLGFAAEEFLRDSTGTVVSLKHYQNGRISTFNKK